MAFCFPFSCNGIGEGCLLDLCNKTRDYELLRIIIVSMVANWIALLTHKGPVFYPGFSHVPDSFQSP